MLLKKDTSRFSLLPYSDIFEVFVLSVSQFVIKTYDGKTLRCTVDIELMLCTVQYSMSTPENLITGAK